MSLKLLLINSSKLLRVYPNNVSFSFRKSFATTSFRKNTSFRNDEEKNCEDFKKLEKEVIILEKKISIITANKIKERIVESEKLVSQSNEVKTYSAKDNWKTVFDTIACLAVGCWMLFFSSIFIFIISRAFK